MTIILLDNFDSFTYNLMVQFRLMGHEVRVFRNDVSAEFIAAALLDSSSQRMLVLSPGPGTPREAGCMMKLISLVAGKVPILGICLGHQALVEHFGGEIGRAPRIVHGKASAIYHNGAGVFAGLPVPLQVARYHSLVATKIPPSLDVVATSSDQLVMAVAHKFEPIVGFQFHPESILTQTGQALLDNAIHYLRMPHDAAMDCIAV